MKILMVQTYHFHRGGDSTYMFNLTRLLREHGHEVVHFAMRHPLNLPSPQAEYFAPEIDFPALLERASPAAAWTVLSRGIHNRRARRSIARLADDTAPDIAHLHNIHGHLTTSILVPLKKRGIPVVWTCHDYRLVCPNSTFLCRGELCERCLPRRYWHAVLRRCKKGSLGSSTVAALTSVHDRLIGVTRRVDRFVAPSRFLAGKLAAGGIDPRRIACIPNFVEPGPPGEDERRLPGPPAPSGEDEHCLPSPSDQSGEGERRLPGPPAPSCENEYCLYFGRLLHEKGIDILIRAAGSLGRGRVVIAGEGPLRDELGRLAARLAAGRVEFCGFKSGSELGALVAGARFVVVPSRWYENQPFSIMEAMAAGRAVVAADIGAIPEMVEDGVTGLLFPAGDEQALRECLERLFGDPALGSELGARGQEKAGLLYQRQGHYERIMQVYTEVLAARVS